MSTWRIGTNDTAVAPCALTNDSSRVARHFVVRPAERYCDILVVPVVALRPSLDGTTPDPGNSIVMTSDGRYVTTSRTNQLLVWAPNGSFIRVVGRSGEGPGEFSGRRPIELFIDKHDSVFVLDGAQRWSVFTPQLELKRTFLGRFNGKSARSVNVFSNRGIVTVGALPGVHSTLSFHLMGFDGAPVSSFGPAVARRSQDSEWTYNVRMSAVADSHSFWVTPPNGHSGPITLQRWSLDEQLLTQAEMRTPWFPKGGYANQLEPLLPEYEDLHYDSDGLLWVVLRVRDKRWRVIKDELRRYESRGRLYDTRLEVIDPVAGVSVASFKRDGPHEERPPFGRFIPGTRRSYRKITDDAGLETLELFDVYLVAKEAR